MHIFTKRLTAIVLIVLAVLSATAWWAYSTYVAPTKIAIVSFPGFAVEKMERANNNPWVHLERLELEELDKLHNYPFALIRGHGIRISTEQLDLIRNASEKGSKIYIADITNPEYELTNLYGQELDYVSALVDNKGSKNFQSLFNYVRSEIERKRAFLEPYEDPVIIPRDFLFHLEEDLTFTTVEAYETYCREKGFHKEGRPRVALLAGNVNMQNSNSEHTVEFIEGLEKQELNVYCINSFGKKRIELLEEIKPDIVLLRPHGRLAMGLQDKAVDWLKKQNIPVLTPQTIYGEYDEWLKDPQGMYGGMMSMSIVMPELDGAVAPYAVIAQYKNSAGNLIFDGIDNRIAEFSEMTAKWLELQNTDNRDKKVAIYYFKGPGKNAFVASGMEVIPSLFSVLKKLQADGYNLDGLPETKEEFEEILMRKGPVLGSYALGAIDDYMKNGEPQLVTKEQYEEWCRQAMPDELYRDVTENYGEAPGNYMSVEKDGQECIAVTRVRFGNICLLPQPLPGVGDDTQQLVHGAKIAPPHTYIASYLWARYGFEADAVLHFGTHGSLEFTPGKQVTLSDYDWPDRLIGTTPHFYVYTINNIGEGIIAKRRSYATLLTHLTPPFMRSGLRSDLERLHTKLDKYNSLPEGPVREEYALSVKELTEKLNIHRTLNIDSTKNYDSGVIEAIHEHLEEIEQEKVTAGLYTLGVPYSESKLNSSARLMSLDPVAFSLAELDVMRGNITQEQYRNALFVSKRYRPKASRVIRQVMQGAKPNALIATLVTKEELDMAEIWEAENREFDLLALMMSQPGKSDEKEKKVDEKRLPALIVKLCSQVKNREYIEKLQSDKVFEKASQMLDPAKRAKAEKLADKMKGMAPEMYEAISLATQPEMLDLLRLMQDEALRTRTFELLEDQQLAEKIKAEHLDMLKERANICDLPENTQWLNLVFSGEIAQLTETLSLDALKNGLEITEFIQGSHESFVYCENKSYAERFANKELWNAAFESATSVINRKIAQKEERTARYAKAVLKIRETVTNAKQHKVNLAISPQKEHAAILNALNGGYTAPSSGGDPIVNPRALPTGRNMYAVDAERTPSEEAWKVGKKLAVSLLEKEKQLKGRYPKKISFTLWSTNFISTEGATIAQILYLLGVEPVRDAMGTVRTLRLIPVEELKRPRIDVVIQTSGQLRDIAASRLDLINKAIILASEAHDADSLNFVKRGLLDAEKYLLDKGFSPLDARKFSSKRIFGGINGNYGTNIMGLVEKGDAWVDEKEVARQYIDNMGAIYESGEDWGTYRKGIFEAALQNTETVVQPRSSNIWGPLSLDHVYEFMGGLNLAVRTVTGNDPTAYFNDFRNVSRPKMQELKEAIGVETNSTVFNPKYIQELLEGEASSMETFAETFRNTYGWNVMKPATIDDHIWDSYHDIYVKDILDLDVRERFEAENPYALQEMSSVMLETARKGYWKASEEQLKELARLHAELLRDHEAGCSGFVCDNAKLREFIASKLTSSLAKEYQKAISNAREVQLDDAKQSVVLKKEETEKQQNKKTRQENSDSKNSYTLWIVAAVLLLLLVFFVLKKRNR
ncbi:cobaltochelatase subunit CobN [Prosthecochloris sp. SCSIO W1101]|uniref:cobaltochelatase subunit CobN n=1 Tax=Prosthecochloris sp. SCSIO W1101 TaxID=2992242 RepID=UPI00223D7A30|nr:cobaltochelatase subunit CobN [Prosthecochloris sp. SCSIO W1101]UZJ42368.1 cobaltochelatase subunit CobN [Prosthecochloris sp. SCSIO W1101]